MGESFQDWLVERTCELSRQVGSLRFSIDAYIYNPLEYAWAVHEEYLRRYVHHDVRAVFLGMNPGPFGMTQTGVPFGEIHAVRDWMDLEKPVGKPSEEHPSRPVLGFATTRSEISGKRLWSLMADRFGSASACFATLAVLNYCPLVFVSKEPTGRNIVPEKLPRHELLQLEAVCDEWLDAVLLSMDPPYLVGIGAYAARKLHQAVERTGLSSKVCTILHPSPGNPRANADWAGEVTKTLSACGVWS